MKFGFVASAGSTTQVLQMAVEAEAAGWDGFFTWDGISVGSVDTYDPWSLLGAIAVRTERIRIGAMVFALPRRRPWKVAREAITVDHLSGGRLIMPVGLGANDDAGISRVSGETLDRSERAARLDETLEILDQAWQGKSFSYEGEHYSVTDLVFRPRPVQQPRIPIWVVGTWPAPPSMRRAARWDGMMPSLRGDPFAEVQPIHVAEIGAWMIDERNAPTAYDIVLEGVLPDDDPAAAADRLGSLADAGATWWIESRWAAPLNEPDALLHRIRQGPPRV